MSDSLPKLDNSDFARLRTEGYVYVDKTRQIHRMVTSAIYFFLSRPRRFGKSVTVSTLKHLFSGRRELFEDLWIGEKEDRWEWTSHPVLELDFNLMPTREPGDLHDQLSLRFDRIASEHEVELPDALPSAKFAELIRQLADKYGQRVVVLVDEYDKPLIDHLPGLRWYLTLSQTMSDSLPKLPLDNSDFARLRTEGYVYVDKTRQIHRMVTSAIYFFLSRPRRFGKSVTVSTLKHLFSGRRELFEDLWIGEKEDRWEWTSHPVLELDFNLMPTREPGDLHDQLSLRFDRIASEHEVELPDASAVGEICRVNPATRRQIRPTRRGPGRRI